MRMRTWPEVSLGPRARGERKGGALARLLFLIMETDPPPSGFSQPYSLDTNSHAQVYQHDLLGDYKRLIVKLGDALNDDESKGKIRYLHKDKLGGACGEDTKASALDLLKKLEEKGLFSARNISPLESLLKDVDRCDLIESHLEPYRRKYAHQLSQAGEGLRVRIKMCIFVKKILSTVRAQLTNSK